MICRSQFENIYCLSREVSTQVLVLVLLLFFTLVRLLSGAETIREVREDATGLEGSTAVRRSLWPGEAALDGAWEPFARPTGGWELGRALSCFSLGPFPGDVPARPHSVHPPGGRSRGLLALGSTLSSFAAVGQHP